MDEMRDGSEMRDARCEMARCEMAEMAEMRDGEMGEMGEMGPR